MDQDVRIAWLPGDCGPGEYWDPSHGGCEMRPSEERFQHVMLHGNIFGVQTWESGPRADNKFASPQMVMASYGDAVSQHHYLKAQMMLTGERWSFPDAGYPEYLQVGEAHADGTPYVDHQHPHSSPIMEMSVSDAIRLGEDSLLTVSFAPRGPSSDGPVAFMHRVTGVLNPDAPLGHHIGQDVGHISSTVLTAGYHTGKEIFEVSGFHGAEPEPTKVDLPMGPMDSVAFRWTHLINANWTAMASWAHVNTSGVADEADPDSEDFGVTSTQRTSASLYWTKRVAGCELSNTFIFGDLETAGNQSTQLSFLNEFAAHIHHHYYWGRLEILQRVPIQLEIPINAATPDRPRWVQAVTLGFTQRVARFDDVELRAGLSGTLDFIPEDFQGEYGSLPMTGRVFVELSGMKMWML